MDNETIRLQQILNKAGMANLTVIDEDTILAIVDDDPQLFHRCDKYGGHPLSGLASFGGIYGDHRMIQHIAEDITAAFNLLKQTVTDDNT